MNYIDIIIAILLLISIFIGWRQGFIRQLFGLMALFLGLFCAYRFSHFTAHYISDWFEVSEPITNGVAFVVTFIIVLLVVVLVGRFADKIISMVAFAFFNRLLGAILSLLKAVLIISVLLLILNIFGLIPQAHQNQSTLYRSMEKIGVAVFPYLKQLVEETKNLF
ncbi:MAG: CvpA family protein [Prevotellaceae bacterium]|jgi:membrane protein required for colicin V production|nr:CvpA family protein [Prevotellaceae bacterium]